MILTSVHNVNINLTKHRLWTNYVKECASDATLSLKDVCEHFRISQRYVCQLFQKYLNTTFRQRLRRHRVELAKKILEATDKPMYQVAVLCGFKSASRFSEAFLRMEGRVPRKFAAGPSARSTS